jgi:hypothetical protein
MLVNAEACMTLRHLISLSIRYLPYAVFSVCLFQVWRAKRTGRQWSEHALRRQRLIAVGLVSIALALSLIVVVLSRGSMRSPYVVLDLEALVLALLLHQLFVARPSQ